LHGDMDQRARMSVLANFKDGRLQFLVASDVAARGLDIPEVSHVFNFDVPTHAEDYVHRIGRTGRAGRLGTAFTIVSVSDKKYIDAIEKMNGETLEWLDGDLSTLEPPSASEAKNQESAAQSRSRAKPDKSAKIAKKPVKEPKQQEAKKSEEKAIIDDSVSSSSKLTRTASKKQARAENREETIAGFGDDIPAFMLIPIK